jgi:hypothetical protein
LGGELQQMEIRLGKIVPDSLSTLNPGVLGFYTLIS